MGIVMATVSLLFTATLIVEGSGMTFSASFQSRMEKASALICTSARKTRLIWMPIRTRSAALFQ